MALTRQEVNEMIVTSVTFQLHKLREEMGSIAEMKFKEFVTFLLDKDGTFEEVKREFNASFYYMDDHWSSYYK